MSNGEGSKNDHAWEKLFQEYNILSHIETHGYFTISASQMKRYREPRLMAKFDHKINLPQIFAQNALAILPISRGSYIISHIEAYQSFQTLDRSVIYKALIHLTFQVRRLL